jgi:hypothetical protein
MKSFIGASSRIVRSMLFDIEGGGLATPILMVLHALHALQQATELRSTVVTEIAITQPSA